MAYIGQETKAIIAANLKKVIPAGWKWSLGIKNHMALTLKIQSAPVDLLGHIQSVWDKRVAYGCSDQSKVGSYVSLNVYHLHNSLSGELLELFEKINETMNLGNHDNSDIQTDYFDVGWYVYISIGAYNKPFVSTARVLEFA